jgi:ADP-ribose pyrophosphatase YjhB (NUDIX family)
MPETLDTKLKRKIKKPAQLVKIAETIKTDILSHLDGPGIELFEEVYDLAPDSLKQLLVQTTKQLDTAIEKSQSPLKVSLIGPFSSGKTITLCTLLNKPDFLPRSAQPTSGNVVEVQIVPPQSSKATQTMQCHLFSLLELEDMLRDYYTYLQNNYLSDLKKLPEQPGFLREHIHILCTDINKLLEHKWIEHKQGQMRFPFRGLSHLAHLYFILFTIQHFLHNYPQISNTKALVLELPYDSQDKKAQERLISVIMLDMQWALDDMNPTVLEQKVQKLATTLPTVLDELIQAAQQGHLSNEALRALLPLYKRIVLTQEMEVKNWTGAERITFMDFPGTGSDNRRDVYLCLNKLPEAHVNILFFAANKPTIAQAQPLIDIIMEAKQHLRHLAKRLIPALNFFDNYAELPAEIDEAQEANHPEAQQLAWQRVQDFFSKAKLDDVDGLKVGFDVFEQSILGQLFANQKDWNYFLLSPVVSIDEALLTDKERAYLSTYREQSARYGQLVQDLKTSIRYLKEQQKKQQDRHQYAAEIDKYYRLQEALKAYQTDGGINFLREELIDKLKENGLDLLVEDAKPPLQKSLQQLERELITNLREEVDLGDLGDESEEAIDNKEARNRVIALWEKMHALTSHWAGSGQISLMHRGHQVTEPRDPTDNEYVDPLQLCEAQVLRTVLEDEFWQEWAQRWIAPADNNQATPLTALVEQYHQLEMTLDAWTTQAIQQTLTDTLERLDSEEQEIEIGGQKIHESFQSLRDTLEQDYLRSDKLDQAEKASLKNWFSLTSLASELRAQLDILKQQQNTLDLSNQKVPFNENQDFNWTAVEVMKIQRQVILTLQRRVAHEFAFYTATFAAEFQRQLNNRFYDRTHSLDKFKAHCSIPNGIFDRLADIPLTEEAEQKEVDDMNRKEKRRKAEAKAALILEAWDNLF